MQWEISSSTCSSLIREVTKIKAEDLEASLIISKPALPPHSLGPSATAQQAEYAGVGGEMNVFTATAQTLYSLHKLSPSMCASIQRWVDTTFMYGAPDTKAVFRASKRGP